MSVSSLRETALFRALDHPRLQNDPAVGRVARQILRELSEAMLIPKFRPISCRFPPNRRGTIDEFEARETIRAIRNQAISDIEEFKLPSQLLEEPLETLLSTIRRVQAPIRNRDLVTIFDQIKKQIPAENRPQFTGSLDEQAASIRTWMGKNRELLSKVTKIKLFYTAIRYLPPEINLLTNLKKLSLIFESTIDLPALRLSNLEQINLASLQSRPFSATFENHSLPRLRFLDLLNIDLGALRKLPSKLTSFSVTNCTLQALPKLPSGLTSLSIKKSKLRTLSSNDLPSGLISLSIEDSQLETLPSDLPETLTSLSVINSPLQALPRLPTGLTSLLVDKSSLQALPYDLPKTLTALRVMDSPLQALPELPPGLISLDISGTLVRRLPRNLPPNLAQLNFQKTPLATQFSRIPREERPPTLQYVNLDSYNVNLASYNSLDRGSIPAFHAFMQSQPEASGAGGAAAAAAAAASLVDENAGAGV